MRSWRKRNLLQLCHYKSFCKWMPQEKTKLEEQIQRLFTCGYNEQDWTSCDYFVYLCKLQKYLVHWLWSFKTSHLLKRNIFNLWRIHFGSQSIYWKQQCSWHLCEKIIIVFNLPNGMSKCIWNVSQSQQNIYIGKSINETRFQGGIWNQKPLVEVFIFKQGGCSSYPSVDL
jgi:hypothetical protein